MRRLRETDPIGQIAFIRDDLDDDDSPIVRRLRVKRHRWNGRHDITEMEGGDLYVTSECIVAESPEELASLEAEALGGGG